MGEKPPLGSQTLLAQKIGAAVAKSMHKRGASKVPPHRWAEKIARLAQRLLFVGLVVLAVKLNWPWYVIAGSALLALRALAPEVFDSTVTALLRFGQQAKNLKDGQ